MERTTEEGSRVMSKIVSKGMKKDTFEQHLACYGAKISRWPDALRDEAQQALRDAPELQARLQEEVEFEALLRDVPFEESASNLAQRIITTAAPVEHAQRRSAWDVVQELLWPQPAFVYAMMLLLGVWVGQAAPVERAQEAALYDASYEVSGFWFDEEELL